MSGSTGSSERLDSWKEIAGYLHRGARTVQRWEREEGLPIHRLQHDKLGSVYAYRSELDAWWNRHGAAKRGEGESATVPGATLAVLPFSDLSEAKDQAYFCDGIAEEVIGTVTGLSGVSVASRTSSFQFRPPDADIREIARRLRVSHVLEGSVRRCGGRVRIAVQLIATTTGYHVWADRYDRDLQDIFAVQDDIARCVSAALRKKLGADAAEPQRKPPTNNMEGYDCYLRGRSFYYQYGPVDMDCAVQLFARAVELDPSFAHAYAGLADCWSYIYLYSNRNAAVLAQAEWASNKALEIDPNLGPALASRGLCYSAGGRDEEAERDFESAIRLDPRLFEARYYYARHSFARGQRDKAIRLYEAAMLARPEDYQSPLLVAQSYEATGRGAEAEAARRRGIQLAEDHLKRHPQDARALYMAANGLAAVGDSNRAREWAERALEMRPEDSMVLYNAGCIFSMLGLADRAIEVLTKAVANGLRQRGWYENDTNLDPLRKDPRFQALVERLA